MVTATEASAAYQRYGPAVRRKCERVLGNVADAEDVVQGLFADLLGRADPTLDLPYLYRAATHRCLNLLRDGRRRRELLERASPGLQGPPRGALDEQVVSLDLLQRLAAELDPRSAEILVYRCCDALSQDEVATLMGISRRAVVKRLAQIRERIATLQGEARGGAA